MRSILENEKNQTYNSFKTFVRQANSLQTFNPSQILDPTMFYYIIIILHYMEIG